MTVVTRFAPSPTGRLHVGNIRTALHNALFARKNGGRFLLRIDDTDLERSREEYVEAIVDDLNWLGLKSDAMVRQSERFALYEREFDRLKSAGRVYACYETPDELELRRKVLLGRGLPPVYERKPEGSPVPDGVAPHWRFKLDHEHPIEWDDLIRGHQKFDPKLISDPVIRRADGSWLYLLPSVIDDIDLADHPHRPRRGSCVEQRGPAADVRRSWSEAAEVSPMKRCWSRRRASLSKRLGSYGAEHLREEGVEPMALLSLLARIGTSEPVEAVASLDDLAGTFDFSHFGRAPAHFDPHEVELLNAKLLHQLDYAEVADRLPEGVGEAEWLVLRGNLARLGEAADWVPVLSGEIDPPEVVPDDKPLMEEAAQVAEAIDWSEDPWHALTDQLKSSTGRKGRALFRPLRLAITGRESGPEMAPLVKLIGRDRTVQRLQRTASA